MAYCNYYIIEQFNDDYPQLVLDPEGMVKVFDGLLEAEKYGVKHCQKPYYIPANVNIPQVIKDCINEISTLRFECLTSEEDNIDTSFEDALSKLIE